VNKTQVKKLLVEERKSMREKQKHSEFMRKTLSIFNGQVRRADELGRKPSYTLEIFRRFFRAGLDAGCHYTGVRLTLKTATVDHDEPIARGGTFNLDNLKVCSVSANFQKGIMTGAEYSQLMEQARILLDPVALDDLKRRLTTGGKWLARKF